MNRDRMLWKLAGRIYHEAVFQAGTSSAGSNVARLMERMDANARYIPRQARMVQILGSVYLLVAAVLPAATISQLASGTTHQWNVLISTFAGTIFLLIQTGYLMILTLLATAEILAPDLYRWPESLPIRSEHAGMLRLLALAREFLLPLVVILLAYPVVAGIASRNALVGALALPVSVTHAAATLSLIVLASWRLRKVMRSASGSDRKATTIRVVTMAGYGIGIVLIIAVMQFGSNLITSLLDDPRMSVEGARTVAQVLALLPLPTAAASLVGALAARTAGLPVGPPLWMPIVGTVLYGVAALLLFRSAWRIMGRREEVEPARASAVVAAAPATGLDAAATGVYAAATGWIATDDAGPGFPRTPASIAEGAAPADRLTARPARVAFRRQILQTATRDTQVLMSLIMPLFMPVFMLAGPYFGGAPAAYMVYAGPLAAAVIGGWLLIMGLTRPGLGTGRLEATLPLRERDRAFPRLGLAALIPAAGALIAAALFVRGGDRPDAVLLAAVPAVSVPVGFLVKAALFGRVGRRRPVVVEEISVEHRFWKWVVTILAVLVTAAAGTAVKVLTGHFLPRAAGLVLYGVVVAGLGLGVRMLSGRMFPAGTRG